MDKIKVYKTYNAADIAAIEPQLKGTLRSFPDFAIGNTYIQINSNGTWYVKADKNLMNPTRLGIIKNEKDAFEAAKKWMQKFDKKLSGRVLDEQLPKHFFDADLLQVSAIPVVNEVYGVKVPTEWLCYYKIQVKPSSDEKAVVIDNAQIHISISSGGKVLSVEYSYLPVNEVFNVDRKVLQSNELLSIGYNFLFTQNIISPYYYIVTKNDESN